MATQGAICKRDTVLTSEFKCNNLITSNASLDLFHCPFRFVTQATGWSSVCFSLKKYSFEERTELSVAVLSFCCLVETRTVNFATSPSARIKWCYRYFDLIGTREWSKKENVFCIASKSSATVFLWCYNKHLFSKAPCNPFSSWSNTGSLRDFTVRIHKLR